MVFKMNFFLGWPIFRGYVKLREGSNQYYIVLSVLVPTT